MKLCTDCKYEKEECCSLMINPINGNYLSCVHARGLNAFSCYGYADGIKNTHETPDGIGMSRCGPIGYNWEQK